MWPEPQDWGFVPQPAMAPHTSCAPRQHRFPAAHRAAASQQHPRDVQHVQLIPTHGIGSKRRVAPQGTAGTWDPQKNTHLKQHPEFVASSDTTRRGLSCPQAPSVLTFPVCPVKQMLWQGHRVTYPCIAVSNLLIYLLFIYLSIIHLFTGNLEAIRKALLVILL